MPSEFALITRYFQRPTPSARLGIGDDAALITPSAGMELAISTDMLVVGTHFLPAADAEGLGWKTLAVNVSDLAAMGARPRWALLACALPEADETWLARFTQGFFACAEAFGVELIGGDTTRGARAFAVTILGEVPCGQALTRAGARAGDEIWVSGAPGQAALGLAHLQGKVALEEPQRSACLAALPRPQPRLALGLALRGLATAAIDVSDGLLADLSHILSASGLAARLTLDVEAVPTFAQHCFLAGGDDYELVFTAPSNRHEEVLALGEKLGLPLTCLGDCRPGPAGFLDVRTRAGEPVAFSTLGYDHFA
ncbi:MAG: thiamine-phosphate kinase [Rhodocyclaceae bacterium]|nr:thiamine-phosphate kinase [Rhodocyclaceae bacterium]